MTKRIVPGRNFNVDIYWDTVDVDSGKGLGSVTATIPILKNSLVRTVLAYVMREGVGGSTSAAKLVIGDADVADAFMLEQNLMVTKGQLYGNDPDELGRYLKLIRPYDEKYTELTPQTPFDQERGKFYTAESSLIVKTTVSTAVLTEWSAKVRVWVEIIRLLVEED